MWDPGIDLEEKTPWGLHRGRGAHINIKRNGWDVFMSVHVSMSAIEKSVKRAAEGMQGECFSACVCVCKSALWWMMSTVAFITRMTHLCPFSPPPSLWLEYTLESPWHYTVRWRSQWIFLLTAIFVWPLSPLGLWLFINTLLTVCACVVCQSVSVFSLEKPWTCVCLLSDRRWLALSGF